MREPTTESMASLIVLLLAATVNAEYIFTFPKSLEAKKHTSFCLSNSLDSSDFALLGGKYDFNITLTLEQLPKVKREEPASEEMRIKYFMGFTLTDVMSEDVNYCGKFPVPKDEGKYTVNAELLLISKDGREQVVFNESTAVRVIEPDYITLIQTDKPVYKPGQTVKFRLMVMDYQLIPALVNYSQIYIQSPQGLRLMQWKDVQSTKAFISLEMPLGEDPFLGNWKIKAEHSYGKSEASFKVEEYVLPKFEVTVTPPTYLLPTTKSIHGTVCAKYTYGQPVKGNVSLTVSFGDIQRTYAFWKNRPAVTLIDKALDSEGCYEIYVKSEEMKLGYSGYISWGELKIKATVIEEGTNIKKTRISNGPNLSREVLKLTFEDDSDNNYKPWIPYRGRLIVKNTDGSPAPGEEIQISATSGYSSYLYSPYVGIRPPRHEVQYLWRKNFTSDENGVVHFVITNVHPTVGYLSLAAEAVLFDDRYSFGDGFLKTFRPTTYSSIRRWHSASNSYIYIPDIDHEVPCGSELELEVFYTTPTESTYNFKSMVKAGDRVVYTNVQTVTFDGMIKFDIIEVDPDQLLVPEFDVWEPVEVEEPPILPDVFTPLGDEPVKEETVVPEVVVTLGNEIEPEPEAEKEEDSTRLIGKFMLKVPVTHDMSPDAQLLVYYMRDDGEIIATAVKFNVEKCFKNKVEMSFKEEKLRPGSETEFTLKASPSSTCFVGMVDKNINLLGGQNQLTPAKVFEKVRKVARPYSWVSYWREDKNYCERKYPDVTPPPGYGFRRMLPVGVDAVKSFRDFNSWVVTDGALETRPCKEDPPVYCGELGGKNPYVKWFTSIFLLFLWVIYIVLASLKATDVLKWEV